MKTLEGVVVSTKMLKTVVVSVTRKTVHPLYKKLLKRNKKYKVDTAGFEVAVGDRVRISKTRPISKEKHYKIMETLESHKDKKTAIIETQKKSESQKRSTPVGVSKKSSASVVSRRRK
ncbi:MAG: 30S ribosomal protein S17 [Candidatus Levybacteria bacterium]|nr:30S ribosomal protein S17 [Candidatus Levybacteria bacterium]MBI2189989.1 30S ribosomal protein S17 [Candidatus Levybacteria bacterium]MBI2622593.1 30S ribosomal protein S17 [Candidatus Levybacteria bacterium]MBI3070267.1 30S ribosomal protein S17 [Candidatus Levybacteria bacterium]MBI3092988.1 30S ribosomal protein S17 [Candidatus Levybacteria bacterium]